MSRTNVFDEEMPLGAATESFGVVVTQRPRQAALAAWARPA